MSQSAEYCSDKKGDRGGGGGAVAHQRKMIRGLLVWVTLLTLGLAVSMTLHFIHREPPAPEKLQDPGKTSQQEYKDVNLKTFSPNWDERDKVDKLRWKTLSENFIEGEDELTVRDDGRYFVYLQVTLDSHMTDNYTITVNSKYETQQTTILKGLIDKSKLSTGFMGVGIPLNSKETLTVTCNPKAKILTSHTETYLGVIKLCSN